MPSLREELLSATLNHSGGVPQLNIKTMSIESWVWPLATSSKWVCCRLLQEAYREKWEIWNPFCLCGEATGIATESAIYYTFTGKYAQEYVAGCAKNLCGYLVPLSRISVLPKITVGSFPSRCGMNIPSPIIHEELEPWDLEFSWTVDFNFNKRMGDEEADGPDRKRHKVALADITPAEVLPVTTEELLARLDQWERPGISEEQFDKIMAKCSRGTVVTRR